MNKKIGMDVMSFEGGKRIITGNVGQKLSQLGFQAGAARPFLNKNGQPRITVMKGGKPINMPVQNATLRKDEWKQFDDVLLKVAQERLRLVALLQSRGLTFNLTNGLGTTVLQYEDISDMTPAEISMNGETRSKMDRPEFDINSLPIPLIYKDFQINLRQLEASRRVGDPLDTTMIEQGTRQVIEFIEDMVVNGLTGGFAFGGGNIYGLKDHPNVNTGSFTSDWASSAATGESILADVIAMKQALIDANYFGPYVLLIPTNFETVLDGDFKAGSDKSIRTRLLEVAELTDIMVVDKLTASNVLMVQLTSDVVRLVNGLGLTTIEWESNGGFVQNFKVIAIQVPQVRSDQEGQSGIALWT